MARLTKQKTLLLREMSCFQSFFSADDLLARVSLQGIGLATVYRFLKDQEKKGAIHSFICSERKIYSQSTKNHLHFSCERCGNKQHLQLSRLDFLQENIPGKVCHFQIDISGICDSCSKK